MKQNDEALRLLAQMYARWFMRASARSVLEACERIRDTLYTAVSQQDAYEQLVQLAEAPSERESYHRPAYEQARDIVAQVIQAGGSADTLIVGQTDGYRHLCLTCSQDEQNFQRVHFFHRQERRPLLKPEVRGEQRSVCQLCSQPIHPDKLVLFAFAGTEKHDHACRCGMCNRAGIGVNPFYRTQRKVNFRLQVGKRLQTQQEVSNRG